MSGVPFFFPLGRPGRLVAGYIFSTKDQWPWPSVNRPQFVHNLFNALIGDVRGLGLQIGVELTRGGKPAQDEADALMYAALAEGLSFKVSNRSVLTLSPPLTITKEEMDCALEILERCLARVSAAQLAP